MARKRTIKKKRGKSKRTKKRVAKKPDSISTFENVKDFSTSFKPAIRVRAIRPSPQKRVNLVLGNLILFIILFALSSVLYIASTPNFYKTLFFLLSLIFGGLAIAFLIILLALVFLRILKQ